MAGPEALLGETLNDVEALEARAYGAAAERLGGGVREVRGGLCVHAPAAALILNRVVAVTGELDLDEVAAVYAFPHLVTVAPGAEGIEPALAERGYARVDPWVKFTRDASPAPQARTLEVRQTRDEDVLAATIVEGFGTPPELEKAFHVLSNDGFSGFVAWDGDEPAGAGLLYVRGPLAWLGAAATRPAHRAKGAQTALIAARIEHARAAGATTLTVETAPEGPSNRNVQRLGFRQEYVRANWQSPA